MWKPKRKVADEAVAGVPEVIFRNRNENDSESVSLTLVSRAVPGRFPTNGVLVVPVGVPAIERAFDPKTESTLMAAVPFELDFAR